QNQLDSIPEISAERPNTSRVFTYLRTVTPKDVFISSIEIDVVNSTMEITGTSSSLALINTFADTLKFATFTYVDVDDEEGESRVDDGDRPFFNVITDGTRDQEEATYAIELEYDPLLFDNTKTVSIIVPENTVTTRSVTNQPEIDRENNGALFNAPEEDDEGEQ
uniref:hypothetical protein n=1 Tax=Candidatus Electrothrix sp. TaxID=2170559 RepID=UPI004056B848